MKYEIQNTPQLRFPGFEGEWKCEKLKDISKIERGRFSPRPRNNPIYYNGKIPFVQTSDIVNANGKIEFYTQTLNEKGLAVSKLFPKGSILITVAANIGHSGVLQIDMACPDSLIGIKPNSNIHNYYLNYYLSTHQKKMDYLAPEGAQKNINIEFLNPYKIPFPTLPEQQKIASFLSAVDEKIHQLSRKKELLSQYKKGVMQQLFSGKLRFKDENGEDYSDWEEKRLGELAKITTGKLDANAMVHDGEYRFYTCAKDYYRIDKFAFDTEALLISGNGANVGYIHYYKGKFNAYQRTYVLDRIKEDIFYLKFYLDNFLQERIYTEKKEGNTPYIVMSTLSEMEILLPSLPEQQKIANFLSSIDAKIERTSQQITQTQSFKKGLLQQLFV
jgi:type I restriction enzyme S subunit